MPVFYYVSAEPADAAREAVLAFTHGDRFKSIPGYQVMNHHYHMALGARLRTAGSADAEIEDLAAIRALGINIVQSHRGCRLEPCVRAGSARYAGDPPIPDRGRPPAFGQGLPRATERRVLRQLLRWTYDLLYLRHTTLAVRTQAWSATHRRDRAIWRGLQPRIRRGPAGDGQA